LRERDARAQLHPLDDHLGGDHADRVRVYQAARSHQTALLVGFATVPNLLWWSLGQDPKLILFGFNILAGLGLAGYALLFIHIMRARHTAEETLVSAPFKTDFKIFAGTILFAIGLGALLQALEPQGPETTWEGGFNDAGESVYTNVTF
jgi:hypothetical protein